MKTRRTAFALALVASALLAHQASAARIAPIQRPVDDITDVRLALAELEQDPEVLFETFVSIHGREYPNEAERALRFEVFTANLARAKEMNSRRESSSEAVYGVRGPFADLTAEEFRQRLLPKPYARPGAAALERVMGEELELTGTYSDVPDFWDWREHNAVTSVKNQGGVGTCWAFSAVGSIEGQHAIKTGNLVSLSVEQISDCDNGAFPQNNSADCGPNGGLPFMAFEYVMNAGGLELESAYPYCIGDWSCNPCFPKGYDEHICGHRLPADKCDPKDSCDAKFDPSKIAVKIDTWASIAPDKNETRMAAELVQSGPVSIGIDAESLQMYWFGIIVSRMCSSDPRAADHAVLLTGFGTAKDMFFQEMKYWEVKNSWGGSWGEKGYFRARFGTNTCGIANHGATAVIH